MGGKLEIDRLIPIGALAAGSVLAVALSAAALTGAFFPDDDTVASYRVEHPSHGLPDVAAADSGDGALAVDADGRDPNSSPTVLSPRIPQATRPSDCLASWFACQPPLPRKELLLDAPKNSPPRARLVA